MVGTTFLQTHKLTDDLNIIGAIQNLLDGALDDHVAKLVESNRVNPVLWPSFEVFHNIYLLLFPDFAQGVALENRIILVVESIIICRFFYF